MFTIYDLPIGMVAVALIIIFPVGIYEYRKLKKKNPGDPLNEMILVAIPMMLMVLFKKCVDEISPNTDFSKIVGIIALLSGILFLVGLAIAWTLSYKRGYIDKERLKQVMPVVKICAGVVILCAIGIVVVNFI